jgi:H+/Cl- antiporter ClcA
MSSNRKSFERFPNAGPLWMCLVASVFALATAGCSGPPTFNILGSYFPSWLVCLGLSIGLTFVAHVFITTKKFADQLWPLPIVYPALVCFFSCTLWLTFFD